MTADPFVRDRLRAAVDSEQFEIDRLFHEITAVSTIEVGGAAPPPRRHWPVTAGALAAAAAAIALAVWAISSHAVRPEHRHTPTPPGPSITPSPTGPASQVRTGVRLVFVGSRNAPNPAGSVYRMRPDDDLPALLQTALGLDAASGSPDGRSIAFVVSGEASGELRVVGVDGDGLRTLTTKSAPTAVTWSPDSSALVFSTQLGALYRIDADGSGLGLIASPPPGCTYADPAWSPDGSRLAFAQECTVLAAERGIGVAEIADWKPRIVAPAEGMWGISWSPDGTHLAFSSADAKLDHDVRVVDVASGAATDLTPDAAQETSPAWSPDGDWIGFARDGALWAMQPDGSQAKAVQGAGSVFVRSLSWTPPPRAVPPAILPPPSGPDVQAVVQLPSGGTWAMAESGGELWVLGHKAIRIDPATNAVDYGFELPVSDSPGGDLIADGRGGVWFTYADGVWHLDATGAVTPRHVPTLTGARSLALGGGRLWVLAQDSIVAFDPVTSQQLLTIPLAPKCACDSLVYFDGSLWVGDRNPVGGVDRIDPATGQVLARIQAGSPAALVVAEGELWDLGDPGVFLIDPATNAARNTDDIPDFEGYAGVRAAVGDGRIWANGGLSGMSAGGSAVYLVDPATGRVANKIDVFRLTQGGCSLAVAGGSLWESCSGFQTDDHGRVTGTTPQDRSYVVRTAIPPAGAQGPSESPAASGFPALDAVDFVDARRGWVAGDGVIEATTDGGATWTRQYEGPAQIDSLQFVDPIDGWAFGEHELLRTMDGGAHWTPAPEPAGGLSQVQFVDAVDGWGVSAGVLVRTTDGGRTWVAAAGSPPADRVCFGDPDHGWLASAADAYRTTDGGRTWTRVFSAPVRDEPAGWRSEIGCTGSDEAWFV
ncbi:MAG TPA: hypothetical protein VNN79_02350, partial [Actinomycetota bacterium]|nr:hypothetical protein [Actinomycetota bacterium]